MKLKNFFATETYAIKNVKTGMFSTGGQIPHMKIEGKSWKNINDIKKHIFQISDGHFCAYYEDCYIVKFKIKPDGSVSESIVCKIVFPHILNC